MQTKTIILALLLLASSLVTAKPLRALSSTPHFLVENCTTRDLVGDIIATPDSLSERFLKLLGRRLFFRYEGNDQPNSEFNSNRYWWVNNLFEVEAAAPENCIPVDILIEIERVYYGTNQDNLGSALVRTWLVGPLLSSFTLKNSDWVAGFVQYRVTATYSGQHGPDVGVGRGAIAGDVIDLSREYAIRAAAQPALQDAAYSLLRNMYRSFRIKDGYGVKSGDWKDLQELVEEMKRENGE